MTFIDRYLQYAGTAPAPAAFHRWCALTCLAAAAADRVWLESLGERLAPNLYVFLIGPSGIGKGVASNLALRVLTHSGVVRIYQGMLTAKHLCDMLGRDRSDPKVLLVTPELSLSIGDKVLADPLIRLATELYAGSLYEFSEGTRTHGVVRFSNYCLNWLAGTTAEWLRDSVPRSAVEGGFFARINVVAERGPVPRCPRPVLGLSVLPSLVEDVQRVAQLQGPMTLTRPAEDLYWEWYEQRPGPDTPTAEPIWARVPVHVVKLAMLLSLAEGSSMQVEARHVIEARQLAEQSLRALPRLIEYMALSPDAEGLKIVQDAIREAGTIQHAPLVRAMMERGLSSGKVRDHLDTLRQAGLIEVATPRQRITYTWRGRSLPADG